MKVDCVSCGYEINLEHSVFQDYDGTVKCFSCGAMMNLKSKKGEPCSVEPLYPPQRHRPLGTVRSFTASHEPSLERRTG